MFVADDLAAWLVGLLADAGRKRLTTLVLGSDQERALQRAAAVAIESTATELDPSGGDQAGQLAMVVSEVFRESAPNAPLPGQATLLEALQAGVAERVSVLDDVALTGTGQSSAEVLGVPGGLVAETLARNLVREIMFRGSRGGPLAPLADQLNHDVTHLQGQRLEGMLARLADQVMTLAGTGSPRVASQPVRLLPRPAFLAGREKLLAGLDARFTAVGADGPRVVALCGLGGAGKTSVALEYAHRHLAEVGVAWQFPAGDAAVLAAGFTELAAQLGVRDLGGIRDPVASVHAVLARYAAGWVLIFDNAADLTSVAAFLPPAGPGRVLITSQNQNWPHGQALQVPVLGQEAAVEFLVNRTGDPDRQTAADLASELGGLPLALEQAAAYLQATGDSLAGYLASFRQRRPALLSRGEPTGYHGTVATTWGLASTRLEQSAPAAVGLLRLLAFCAPDAIPLRLLLQARPGLTEDLDPQAAAALVPLLEDPLAAKDAIAALRRYSLITPAGEGAVSVHRLVQAVTADQMPAQLARMWRQATAALVGAAIPEDPEQPGTWTDFAALLPHARAALTAGSAGMARIASYLANSGSYAAGRELSRGLLEARVRVLGAKHPDTLTTRHNLAFHTGLAGDAAGARDQLAALLPLYERALGTGHPGTLSTRGSLARWTGEAGDAAGARDQFAALLPRYERMLGAEHPETLTARHNLARWTGQAGDAAGARDRYATLLPVRERVLGPEHPEILTTRHNLARWTGQAGDAAGARDQVAALLPAMEQVLGPDHPYTLAARRNLAKFTGQAGEPGGARNQFAVLVPVFERVLRPDHPNTLAARADLAYWAGEAGDTVAARDLFAKMLPDLERMLGPEHPDTLAARGNLARWTGQAGDPARARDLFAELVPIEERVLGPEHPDTLTARHNLAYWTGQAGDPARARDLFVELLPVRERILGPDQPHTRITRDSLTRWTKADQDADSWP